MSVLQHVRANLARGLLFALPTIITLWLLRILFGLVTDNVTPWVLALIHATGIGPLDPLHARLFVPLIGVVITLGAIYGLGVLATNFVGRTLLEWVERGILKIPVVRSIYGGSRQLLDALNPKSSGAFSRVVLVEYPRRGVWTVGFVTRDAPARLPIHSGPTETLMVFFPTTPNPTSGWLAAIPPSDVVDLDLTIEEGIKLIMSGGIVMPEAIERRIRPIDPGPAAASDGP